MARRRARRVQAGMTADTRTLYAALQRHAAHRMPCSARAPAERSGRRADRGAAARSVGRERLGRRREEQVPLRLLDRREVACAARSIAARGHAHSVRTACSMTPTRFAFRREPPALHAGPRGHGRRLPRPVRLGAWVRSAAACAAYRSVRWLRGRAGYAGTGLAEAGVARSRESLVYCGTPRRRAEHRMNEAEGGESARAPLAHLRAARPCGTGLVPSMYRTRALTRSTFFSPGLNSRPSTCAHVWHVQSVHARAQCAAFGASGAGWSSVSLACYSVCTIKTSEAYTGTGLSDAAAAVLVLFSFAISQLT